jgi:hypothetical protein
VLEFFRSLGCPVPCLRFGLRVSEWFTNLPSRRGTGGLARHPRLDLEALEGRLVPANFLWTAGGAGGWSDYNNWYSLDAGRRLTDQDALPGRTPGQADSVLFDPLNPALLGAGGGGGCTIDVLNLEPLGTFKVASSYSNKIKFDADVTVSGTFDYQPQSNDNSTLEPANVDQPHKLTVAAPDNGQATATIGFARISVGLEFSQRVTTTMSSLDYHYFAAPVTNNGTIVWTGATSASAAISRTGTPVGSSCRLEATSSSPLATPSSSTPAG